MISVNHLDILYGDRHLFNDVSARINERDRIGLAGVNGTGKSTLLKIIAGLIETDAGVVTRSRYATIAYLPQEATGLPPDRTIYQEAETAFGETLVMQKDLDRVNRELAALDRHSSLFAELLQRQEDLQHRLERTDLFRVKAEIEKVLMGLGFGTSDFDRPCTALSGGWLMRLLLAKQLLAQPSLLLLDEPTNHLDLDSLTWLENFLLSYDGALVIISHDRAFLDKTTAITWELSLGRLTVYKGNYSKYAEEKEQRLIVERASYENQQAKIRQTMRFVQRFRAKSTKAKQVQSRLKQLGKIERIELSAGEESVSFRFPPAADCGRLVLEVAGLTKNFDGKPVFEDVAFQMQRGDKMAVVGVNGAGKSTLVKMLAGLIPPDRGTIRPGHNVMLSYFGQHQAQELPPELTLLEVVAGAASDMTVTRVRSLLGAFLFTGDDVEKKVRVLSGGEKSRLALAKMIAVPANLLVLDEPTNHLDMASQEVLQEAMAQYDGAIIIVSHNRFFVNRFVNKVLEIKTRRASLFEGNIDDYLAKSREMTATEAGRAAKRSRETERPPETDRPDKTRGKEARREQAKLRQERGARLGPYLKAVEESEKEIERLEKLKTDLERRLADPGLYKNEAAFAECSREYGVVTRRLDRCYFKWEEAQSVIEEMEKDSATGPPPSS